MDYSELKELIKNKRLSIAYIAKLIGMTDKGLQYSLKNNKLPLDKFLELCKILEITPNEFFMNNTVQGSNNIVGVINSKVDARQYYSDSPDVLRAQIEVLEERIKEKDSQIKEKDSQIKELLNILKNK